MENTSSKKSVAIIISIVVLLIVAIVIYKVTARPNAQPVAVETQTSEVAPGQDNSKAPVAAAVEMEKYTNSDLGFAFSYPKSWGAVSFNQSNQENFTYSLLFADSDVEIVGTSNPYKNAGRDGYLADFEERSLFDNTCGQHTVSTIRTKDGRIGNYTYAKLILSMGDCFDYKFSHYAVFDVNKKVRNIVIRASDQIDTPTFKALVASLQIYN